MPAVSCCRCVDACVHRRTTADGAGTSSAPSARWRRAFPRVKVCVLAVVSLRCQQAGVRVPAVCRAGTPRQGILTPSSAGVLKLRKEIGAAALDGLSSYSHLWLLYVFHKNTNFFKQERTHLSTAPVEGSSAGAGGERTRARDPLSKPFTFMVSVRARSARSAVLRPAPSPSPTRCCAGRARCRRRRSRARRWASLRRGRRTDPMLSASLPVRVCVCGCCAPAVVP